MLRRFPYSVWLIVILVLSAAASPSNGDPPGSVLYKLGAASTFQQGCWDPCDCPIFEPVEARGTFRLTFLEFDGLFAHYAVDEVDWTVDLGEPRPHVTGSGTYRVGGEFAAMHQLKLDLQVGGDPVQHFDSGLVVGGGDFPQITIVISMNNMYCYDRVFDLHAHPLGDADQDGDVDAADHAVLAECFGGPNGRPDPGSTHTADACLEAFDADGDNDLDLADFARFAEAYRPAGS